MLTLSETANHVVLHCSIYACVMSQMFLFYFIFYGGALVFLGGAGAPASPSLAPPMPKEGAQSLSSRSQAKKTQNTGVRDKYPPRRYPGDVPSDTEEF